MILRGCMFEWDEKRGVAYVHDKKGVTVLRVCRIPVTPFQGLPLDVVSRDPLDAKHAASWRKSIARAKAWASRNREKVRASNNRYNYKRKLAGKR